MDNYDSRDIENKVKAEAQKSLDETLWEGYANSIITGINTNGKVKPDRAIWELVQNARDVAIGESRSSEIYFTRKQDCFEFRHNGQPFTRKTLQALILQTSSKERKDEEIVGQYGTGFLTTHRFGLKFKLSGSLNLLDGQCYVDFQDFLIDRSCDDKKELTGIIKGQVEKTLGWGINGENRKAEPDIWTKFTYLHENEVEKKNVLEAFQTSPMLVPYVIALNESIRSIVFEDEVDGTCDSFEYVDEHVDVDSNDSDYIVKEILLKHAQKDGKDIISLFILTKGVRDINFSIILPLKRINDKLVVFRLNESIPQLFLFLPLLETKKWGWNYIVHSPRFTCDRDSRDSLLLIDNGQSNEEQVKLNKSIIEEAGVLLRKYIDDNYKNLYNAKYLCGLNFMDQQTSELNEYYGKLQHEWINYFENLELVEDINGQKIKAEDILVLNKDLSLACRGNEHLLVSIYSLLSKEEHGLTLPCMDDLIYWSDVMNDWYYGEENERILAWDNIVEYIENTMIEKSDIDWLFTICSYLKSTQKSKYSDNRIFPNEKLKLCSQKDLVKPIKITPTLKRVMEQLIPKEVEKFVHAKFYDIVEDGVNVYAEEDIKEHLSSILTNRFSNVTNPKDKILKEGLTAKIIEEHERNVLNLEEVHAILDLYNMRLPMPNSENNEETFPRTIYNLMCEYYDYNPSASEHVGDNIIDIRNCYNILINDALLRFTLSEEKETFGSWCFKMVKALIGFKDANNFLRSYMVYPNQMGEYKYAEQLAKEEEEILELVKEIYDTICRGVVESDKRTSIQHELVDKEYAPYFIGEAIKRGIDLASEIEKPFANDKDLSISNNQYKDLYLKIIEHLSDNDDAKKWSLLFPKIDCNKANLMLSVVTDPQAKDSLFRIISIEDNNKLNTIADLVKDENFTDIIRRVQEELSKERITAHNKRLGDYVEKGFVAYLKKKMAEQNINVDNIQGGQDVQLKEFEQIKYRIEIKSKWGIDKAVSMTPLQYKTAIDNQCDYALVYVDMSCYDMQKVENDEELDIEGIKDKIMVLRNMGELLESDLYSVYEAFNKDEDKIRAIGDYKIRVPHDVILVNNIGLDEFMEYLRETLLCQNNVEGKTFVFSEAESE